MLTIRRDVLEESILVGLKSNLMHPDLVKEFIAEYHRERKPKREYDMVGIVPPI